MTGDEFAGPAAPDGDTTTEARCALTDAREAALARIPPAYAQALRLRAAGGDQQDIAERLGMEPEAVPALLTIAEAKLTSVIMGTAPWMPNAG